MHTRFITKERVLMLNNKYYSLRKIVGETAFGGCQCNKSCNCHEIFEPMPYVDFRLKKKWGKPKTYTYSTSKAAYKRLRELTKAQKKWKDGKSNTKV